jgi:protein arginine kinase activator
MKCEVCNINNATIHLTKIEEGESITRHLCHECAVKEGIPVVAIENQEAPEEFPWEEDTTIICKNCNTTQIDVETTGIVGCPQCYETFAPILEKELGHRFGYRKYRGKKYSITQSNRFVNELTTLKKELATVISQENFELAAVLRDKVKELEDNLRYEWS